MLIERGTHAPLSEPESDKLKSALHALAGMLPQPRSTEKTKNVLEQSAAPAPENEPEPAKGHGRNGASSYTGAQKVAVPHPQLHAGDPCPGCEKGQSLSAERTSDAGAHRGTSAAGGHRV